MKPNYDTQARPDNTSFERIRLGVIAYGPIQYHVPLWQRLTERGNVSLNVLYLSDRGYQPVIDPGFGRTVSWDIDLISNYSHQFLTSTTQPCKIRNKALALTRWLARQEVVVVNGYTNPWMLSTMALCRYRRIPYLLRASSHPRGPSTGMRAHLRRITVKHIVGASAGGLAMGHLNEEFYRHYGAPEIIFAPNSVNDEYFAKPPRVTRTELLGSLGLKDDRPVVMYCGKLIDRKRPLDLLAAINHLPYDVITLFVGDGPLADTIRASIDSRHVVVTGFVNQSQLPAYYHAADILVLPSEAETWGLVVNEAMAAGTLPIVSDRVGAAPDLVQGVGEIYPCGDIPGLVAALSRALTRIEHYDTRGQVRGHAARYCLDRTAAGFEQGALTAGRSRTPKVRLE